MDKITEKSLLFGKRLQTALNRTDTTQIELAKKIGVSTASVSKYCSGKNTPSDEIVEKIAKTLDVSELWLKGYDIDWESPNIGIMEFSNYTEDEMIVIDRIGADRKLHDILIAYAELLLKAHSQEGGEENGKIQ